MSLQSIHSMRSIDAQSNNPYEEINFPTGGAIAEDTVSVRSKQSKFKRKHRFQCALCVGKACPVEDASRCKNPAVKGLNSALIMDKIVASARPTKKKIRDFNIVQQMLE